MFNLAQMIYQFGRETPEKVALVDGDATVTYAELDRAIDECALGMLSRGLQPGESVGIQLANSADFVVSFYGVLRAGLVAVPFNPRAVEREIAHIFQTAQCRALVTGWSTLGSAQEAAKDTDLGLIVCAGDPADRDPAGSSAQARPVVTLADLAGAGRRQLADADELLPVTQADDVAVMIFTSGTTGAPKAAQLTHFNLWTNCTTVASQSSPRESDVVLACLPLFHVFGITSALNTAMAWGMSLVLVSEFSAEGVLANIDRHHVTRMPVVPTMVGDIVAFLAEFDPDGTVYSLTSMKRVSCGGSALPEKLIGDFESRFPAAELLEGYGSSETCSSVCLTPSAAERRIGSVGRPLWGTRARVVDSAGKVLPAGPENLGELQICGPTVFAGYYNAPDQTAKTLQGKWLNTGDVAAIDESGFVFIKDRLKNLIIRGGLNVYAAEVERVLTSHPGVNEAVVVGVPDERLGQEIVAALTMQEGHHLSHEDIEEFMRPRLSRYKHPRRLKFIQEIPRNATGKVRRSEVVAALDDSAAAGS